MGRNTWSCYAPLSTQKKYILLPQRLRFGSGGPSFAGVWDASASAVPGPRASGADFPKLTVIGSRFVTGVATIRNRGASEEKATP